MGDDLKIISVDDHIVEPPHLWQDRLPARFKAKGPRVERARWGDMSLGHGAAYNQEMTDDGEWGDYWLYEDRLIYVHKRHVAIPLDATPGGDLQKFDRLKMPIAPLTYDDMRPGCYEPKARVEDLAAAGVDGSIAFPTFPRFCGQTFMEGDDLDLGLACVQAYNDYMIEEWCADSDGHLIPLCLIPLWDIDLAVAEIRRNAERGARAVCFSEIPTHLGLPSIHTGHWDPVFAIAEETKTTLCMHIGSSSKMLATSDDAPIAVTATLTFNNAMASLSDYLFSGLFPRFPHLRVAYSEGQIGWLPYVLERADDVWETHEGWMHTRALVPEPPSTYYADHVFGCFFRDNHGIESIHKVGVNNVTYETDYPHTDTTWPHTHEYVEKVLANVPDEIVHKILRGNALNMLSLDENLNLVN